MHTEKRGSCRGGKASQAGRDRCVASNLSNKHAVHNRYRCTWKFEQIGFEVAGRVAEVIEPNEFVAPQIGGEIDERAPGATPLARLDDEAFRIAVESALASVQVAKLNRDANLVTIEQQLPAQSESAKAEAELADIELSRALDLSKQNAISRSELDAAQTNASTTKSRLASSRAELAPRHFPKRICRWINCSRGTSAAKSVIRPWGLRSIPESE